jgi:branched-chain amino acid transport system ATP-binding protein
MLEVKNISSGYGKKQVIYDIAFEVGDGETVLLTGGNGSGKSTVLKCIYSLLSVWNKEGKVLFDGKDITELPPSSMVKERIVYIPQKNNYFESLTVEENLYASGSIYKKDVVKQRIEKVYKLPKLYEFRNRTPFNLSGGERQLLALGIGLIHKPKLILFDEPFAGLDVSNSEIMSKELQKIKTQKIAMLIVEHKKSFNSFADKTLNMYLGKIK